jgi:DNA replication protein DnaC
VSALTADRIREHATRLGLTHLTDTITELVQRAEAAQMGYLDFVDLLLEEEVGLREGRRFRTNMVFQLVSRRYERGTMIITSNKSFAEWGGVLGDEVLATAILDRLLHHCDVININGPSYRLKDRLTLVAAGGETMP